MLCLVVSATFGQTLGNGKIKAEFGKYGLKSVHDLILDRYVMFGEDHWSITINDKSIKSAELKPSKISKGKNTLSYYYQAHPFAVEVAYELKPGWRFVSKQLIVSNLKGGDYHIDRVEVFRGILDTPIADEHVIRTAREVFRKHHELRDFGVFVRFDPSWGAFFLVQNPFMEWQSDGGAYSIGYGVDMPWKCDYGPFKSDRGCIGTYKLAGRRSPPYMDSHPKWIMSPDRDHADDGMDLAEVNAYIDCVRAFLLYQPEKSVRVHVPWCENDYQIDVSNEHGEAEWKRIVDMASDLGIEHMLYTCRNDKIVTIEEAADAWRWEHLLWLNMGVSIRRGLWDPRSDVLPEKTRELLSYAKSKNVRMMAYVYPTLPFAQNKDWLTQRFSFDKNRLAANMGFRSFQDWLIENLVAFKRRSGISGYAFDYWFLTLPGTSKYSQWYGCRRVLEELRKQEPDIVIDGRQSYHVYGPWTWLAGTYPHPTAGDEQPESFQPFPDLHFDRSSATHQRYTAYWFRNTQFCPVEIMPGFIGHQTPRKNADGDAPRLENLNVRDWDYLGWKFSLFSSIATAPLSHCVDMIPARDVYEFMSFAQEDKEFIKNWMDWTDENAAILKQMKSITGPPALGYVDGTAAIDEDRGFIFLFNPNHRKMTAEFTLDDAIGVTKGRHFILKHLFPEEGRLIGSPKTGLFSYGDKVSLVMDGVSCLVLELAPVEGDSGKALLFNARGSTTLKGTELALTDVAGEVGVKTRLQVLVPSDKKITAVTVNGAKTPFVRTKNVLTTDIEFAGQYFCHAQQIGSYDPAFCGTTVNAEFRVPQRISDQLKARKEKWPIPWEKSDYECTWLVPERLLIYIQIAEPDWRMNVNITINGEHVEVKKAYSSITPGMLRKNKGNNTFTGFYVDVSHLEADRDYELELTIPRLKPGQFQGLFFENVETEYTDRIIAGK